MARNRGSRGTENKTYTPTDSERLLDRKNDDRNFGGNLGHGSNEKAGINPVLYLAPLLLLLLGGLYYFSTNSAEVEDYAAQIVENNPVEDIEKIALEDTPDVTPVSPKKNTKKQPQQPTIDHQAELERLRREKEEAKEKQRIAEEQRRIAEEQAAYEQEQRRLAEEDAQQAAALATQQQQQAEQQRIAQEQAAAIAAQQQAAQQQIAAAQAREAAAKRQLEQANANTARELDSLVPSLVARGEYITAIQKLNRAQQLSHSSSRATQINSITREGDNQARELIGQIKTIQEDLELSACDEMLESYHIKTRQSTSNASILNQLPCR